MKTILLTTIMLFIGCVTQQETEKEDINGFWCSEHLIDECVNVTDYEIEYTRLNGSFVGVLNVQGELRKYRFSYYNSLISIDFEEITLILERKEYFLH